jgi:hypothetical protein
MGGIALDFVELGVKRHRLFSEACFFICLFDLLKFASGMGIAIT